MRKHTLNMFQLSNIAEINFSFKLIDFDLPCYDGNRENHNKQLQKLVIAVTSLTKGPSALVTRDNRKYIAIPADKFLSETKVDVGPLLVTLKPLSQIYEVKASNFKEVNQDVVLKFLDYEIRRQLSGHKDLWKMGTGQLFEKTPKALDNSNVNIFRGFSYKLVRLDNGNYYIALDLATKYIDKRRLAQCVNETNVSTHGKRFLRKRYLYLNGDSWYPIELVSFGERVDTHTFMKEGKQWLVQDYIFSKPGARMTDMQKVVQAKDLAILYRYPGRDMEPHNGASSLAKMLYRTDDPEVRSFHKLSIKDPSRRFGQIEYFIKKYFQRISCNGQKINISLQPMEEEAKSFPIPSLKYPNNRLLNVGNSNLKDFGYNRKSLLEKNGILNQRQFDAQYLIVPASMEKGLVEAFKAETESAVRKMAPKFTGFRSIIRYPFTEGLAATLQIKKIEEVLIKHQALSGYGLFILPDQYSVSNASIRNLHNQLKTKFYPGLQIQCASSYKINSFFTAVANQGEGDPVAYRVQAEQRGKFNSYLFNLSLELFIVNRKWPYALEHPLHYDIYIGIDVHDRSAGFSFFFKNGEQIFFATHEVPKKNRSQRAEKLKAKLLYDVMYERLKHFIPLHCPNPNGIVVLRDGRSFGEEEEALIKVIEDLKRDNILTNDPKWGIVDLHKQSVIPLRIALQTNGHEGLTNPKAGSYKLFDSKEGFIFNTGYPFNIRGSAKPQHLGLKAGDVSFIQVLEDVFRQSMLAFSAPDRSNSLPISIKVIDILLEPLTEHADEIEEDELEDVLEN